MGAPAGAEAVLANTQEMSKDFRAVYKSALWPEYHSSATSDHTRFIPQTPRFQVPGAEVSKTADLPF